MTPRCTNSRGQAIVMTTLAVFAMFGIIGLAVDLGWSFFIRKAAQAAADSAALASAYAALNAAETGGFACGTIACSGPVPCPGASGNFGNGCLFAAQNGFSTAGVQSVTIEGDLGGNRLPAHSPGVTPIYWTTVRIQQTIPQLFSAVLGNTEGVSGARATAAILDLDTQAALVLLNRARDCVAMNGPSSVVCGVNISAAGNSVIQAQAGIMMASTRHGDNLGITKDGVHYAGEIAGTASVRSDFTGIRGSGTANVPQTDTAHWDKPWQNGLPASDYFNDPMRKYSQPPVTPTSNNVPVAGCTIQGGTSWATALKLAPGNYYGTQGNGCQDGDPIIVKGFVEFMSTSSGGSGFGTYVFYGGLSTSTSSNIQFDPGMYVFAGAKPKGNDAGRSFDASSGQVVLQDQTPGTGANTDAGELFLFTDTNYPGLNSGSIPSTVTSGLSFGSSGFQTGNNSNVTINLHGLNKAAAPSSLDPYNSVVIWQDQRNSTIDYFNADGSKNMTCIIGDAPCTKTPAYPSSPMLSIAASSQVHLYGTVYQPRGAWTSLTGGNSYSGPLRIITGAIAFNGGADLNMQTLGNTLTFRTVAMIE